MKIVIPGDPIPKARARTTKKGFAYDPQWEIKKRVTHYLKLQVDEKWLEYICEDSTNRKEGSNFDLQGVFEVNWYFYMPIPKSLSRIKNNACQWGFQEHIVKPDLSNLVKFYEDCGINILWRDDTQIVRGFISKSYSINPRTEILMTRVPEPNEDIKSIVTMFSVEEVQEIVKDASEIFNVQTADMHKISRFLSKLADNHGPRLLNINKKYNGHWKKIDSSIVQ